MFKFSFLNVHFIPDKKKGQINQNVIKIIIDTNR